MGRISRRKIDPNVEERLFELFHNHLAKLKRSEDIKDFLLSLLSFTEQVTLAKRLAIALLLRKKYTYEEIDQILKVSKSTIGTIHKQLLIGAKGYTTAVEAILSQEKSESFWTKLDEIALQLSLPKRVGSIEWEKKSTQGKSLAKRKRKISAF